MVAELNIFHKCFSKMGPAVSNSHNITVGEMLINFKTLLAIREIFGNVQLQDIYSHTSLRADFE